MLPNKGADGASQPIDTEEDGTGLIGGALQAPGGPKSKGAVEKGTRLFVIRTLKPNSQNLKRATIIGRFSSSRSNFSSPLSLSLPTQTC